MVLAGRTHVSILGMKGSINDLLNKHFVCVPSDLDLPRQGIEHVGIRQENVAIQVSSLFADLNNNNNKSFICTTRK